MIVLSEHFTDKEMIGMQPMPDQDILSNLGKLCNDVLDNCWDTFFEPKEGNPIIHVNSGYRNPIENKRVGGAPNSQHLFGCAADITLSHPRKTNLDLFNFLKRNMQAFGIDQLINEEPGANGIPTWVHVSIPLPEHDPRYMAFAMKNGKMIS